MSGTYDVAETFACVARDLEAATDPDQTQEEATRAAVDTVPGCDSAGISLIKRNGNITSVAPTDELARRIDAIQDEVGEGPCLGTIADHAIYHVADFRETSDQWPTFVERVDAEIGLASMLSFRLFTSGDTVGALNLYGRSPHAFTDDSRAIGAILAAHAAIALAAARERRNAKDLESALHTSRQIGTAVGIIMVRQGLGQDEAFDFLVDASQRLNRKLRDLAGAVVAEGGVPTRR